MKHTESILTLAIAKMTILSFSVTLYFLYLLSLHIGPMLSSFLGIISFASSVVFTIFKVIKGG